MTRLLLAVTTAAVALSAIPAQAQVRVVDLEHGIYTLRGTTPRWALD